MTIPRHPAPWNRDVLLEVRAHVLGERARLNRPLRVLDPFAGSGIDRLSAVVKDTVDGGALVGVEVEAEWAAADPRIVAGDSTDLAGALGPVAAFDVMVTSPCYGNRMADHHEAKDACRDCGGSGEESSALRAAEASPPPPAAARCKACNGFGVTRRNTYRHALGRPLSPDSGAGLQWGPAYRALHRRAWRSCLDVVAPAALVLVNVKNHYRGGVEQPVIEWHLNAWMELGAFVRSVVAVPARGNRQGANGSLRTEGEVLLVMRAPLGPPPGAVSGRWSAGRRAVSTGTGGVL